MLGSKGPIKIVVADPIADCLYNALRTRMWYYKLIQLEQDMEERKLQLLDHSWSPVWPTWDIFLSSRFEIKCYMYLIFVYTVVVNLLLMIIINIYVAFLISNKHLWNSLMYYSKFNYDLESTILLHYEPYFTSLPISLLWKIKVH